MKTIKYIAVLIIIMNVFSLNAAEQSAGMENLRKVSDDMKFQNGVEFFKLEKFDRALSEFNEYIEIYMSGIHRNEALRKIAEIHIRFFNYQKAIDAYRMLYQEYSGTDDGIDAYFQIGVCYKKMGFDKKAEDIFKYIVDEHPGTPAAYNSEIQIDLLKINSD
jgi:TolA-binding protein